MKVNFESLNQYSSRWLTRSKRSDPASAVLHRGFDSPFRYLVTTRRGTSSTSQKKCLLGPIDFGRLFIHVSFQRIVKHHNLLYLIYSVIFSEFLFQNLLEYVQRWTLSKIITLINSTDSGLALDSKRVGVNFLGSNWSNLIIQSEFSGLSIWFDKNKTNLEKWKSWKK